MKVRPAQLVLYNSCHTPPKGAGVAKAAVWILVPYLKAISFGPSYTTRLVITGFWENKNFLPAPRLAFVPL